MPSATGVRPASKLAMAKITSASRNFTPNTGWYHRGSLVSLIDNYQECCTAR